MSNFTSVLYNAIWHVHFGVEITKNCSISGSRYKILAYRPNFRNVKKFLDLSLYGKTKELLCKPPTTCLFVASSSCITYVRPSITHACQTQRSVSLLREKGDFYLTKREPTTINRARETTKRRVLLPRELLDTLLANGSRRPARVSYCCVVGKIDVVREYCPLPFASPLFFPGVALPTFPNRRGCVFPLSFILFYFFFTMSRARHDRQYRLSIGCDLASCH